MKLYVKCRDVGPRSNPLVFLDRNRPFHFDTVFGQVVMTVASLHCFKGGVGECGVSAHIGTGSMIAMVFLRLDLCGQLQLHRYAHVTWFCLARGLRTEGRCWLPRALAV